MYSIELLAAEFVPPSGCSLHGVIQQKNENHFVLISPARGRQYWVAVGGPGSQPNLIKWTGSVKPVEPDLLSLVIARISTVDWHGANWWVDQCKPTPENPAFMDVLARPTVLNRRKIPTAT
jgi:hypothetical protein